METFHFNHFFTIMPNLKLLQCHHTFAHCLTLICSNTRIFVMIFNRLSNPMALHGITKYWNSHLIY